MKNLFDGIANQEDISSLNSCDNMCVGGCQWYGEDDGSNVPAYGKVTCATACWANCDNLCTEAAANVCGSHCGGGCNNTCTGHTK